jgi:hypothetical protein
MLVRMPTPLQVLLLVDGAGAAVRHDQLVVSQIENAIACDAQAGGAKDFGHAGRESDLGGVTDREAGQGL